MNGPPNSDFSQKISLKETFQADAIQQNGRRDNLSLSGVTEESGEDLHQKVVDVAQKAVAAIAKQDISVCHISWEPGPKNIIAKFVRCHTIHNKNGRNKIYNRGKINFNDDVTSLRVNLLYLFRRKKHAGNANSLIEEMLVYMNTEVNKFLVIFKNSFQKNRTSRCSLTL